VTAAISQTIAIMSKILCKLRDAPEEEVEEIRQLLQAHGIDYYETPAGKWGISPAAIWLTDGTQQDEARQLLQAYQADRATRVRQEYARSKSQGSAETLGQRILRDPFKFFFYLAIILVIIYFSIKPFISFGS
jgi:hypothetical protein